MDNKTDISRKILAKAIEEYEAGIARIILSCVDSLEFGVGAIKLSQILTGKQTKFTTDNSLQKNLTFGLLGQFSYKEIAIVVEFLLNNEYLKRVEVKPEVSVVQITPKGMAFLVGDGYLDFSFIDAISKYEFIEMDATSQNLYEALRKCRYKLASERRVPAYVICKDSTLIAIASCRPENPEALKEIKGVGKAFIENYADDFISCVLENSDSKQVIEKTELPVVVTMVKDDPSDVAPPKEDAYTCYDCKLYKREDCAGVGGLCEYFDYAPRVTEDDLKAWGNAAANNAREYYKELRNRWKEING